MSRSLAQKVVVQLWLNQLQESLMNNTSAFPTGLITDDKGLIIGGSNGMGLRDYFAAKALVIVASQCPSVDFIGAAEIAYDFADAMMEARKW